MSIITFLMYVLPLSVMVGLYASRKNKTKYIPILWVWTLMFVLNSYGLIYFELSSVRTLPLNINKNEYFIGATINWVFIVLWSVGYSATCLKNWKIGNKLRRKTAKSKYSWVGVKFFGFTILISGVSTIIKYSLSIPYGATVFNYQSIPFYRYFGILASLKSLFLPSVASYIILRPYFSNHLKSQSLISEKILWILIIIRAFAGLTLDMQRGDVIYPVFVALLVASRRGYLKNTFKLGFYSTVFGIMVLLVSPVIDQLRRPSLYNKDISTSNIAYAVENAYSDGETTPFSMNALFYEPYRKSILPSSTFALKREADVDGFSYFSTYYTSLASLIPRFMWKDKPQPLSIDGDRDTRPGRVAAKNLDMNNIIWYSGGGSMYWQLGWLGVIAGGLIVGAMWGLLTSKFLMSRNYFPVLYYFLLIGWGLDYVRGLDETILNMARSARILFLFWVAYILAKSAFNK